MITGGASGIGKAASELFHSLGSKVVIGDLNETAGNEVAASLGQNCVFQVCDVTKWDSIYSLFERTVKEFGHIDIALANAGVPEIEDIFEERFDAEGRLKEPKYIVLDIDLKGVLASKSEREREGWKRVLAEYGVAVKLAKYFFDKQKSSGAIILTSSTGGVTGDAYLPVYMACKHGVSILIIHLLERWGADMAVVDRTYEIPVRDARDDFLAAQSPRQLRCTFHDR